MEQKLRVCPFCGSKAELIDESDDWYSKYSVDYEWVDFPIRVQCTKCGANIQAGEDDAIEDVIEQWNTRYILDEVADANEYKFNTPEELADLLLGLIAKGNAFKKLTGD